MTLVTQYTGAGLPRSRASEQVDANAVRHRLDAYSWDRNRSVMQLGAWHVYASASCGVGMAYSDRVRRVIVVHPDAWRTMGLDTKAQAAFLRNVIDGASGMRFVLMGRDFAEATRRELERGGAVMAKDLLDQVVEESDRLIVQASGLANASSLQVQVFMSRFAEVQRKLAEAEEKLARARSLVDLAGELVAAIGDE